ncbi:MAG: nucleotide sugar dehydrogenase [Thermoanaerobaculia bacterium]
MPTRHGHERRRDRTGKLGASMAAAFASRGLHVVGVDVDERAVRLLDRGEAPVRETDLARCVHEHRARIRATSSHRDAVLSTDCSFVIVPTPSAPDGSFSLEHAASAFRAIGEALAERDGYHTVVLTSTVLPGATRYALLPILEQASGKRAGEDFGLCYSPEFVALGSVLHDLLHPDMTLVGELDERSGGVVEDIYSRVVVNDAPCRRMSLENAELAKLAVNTFITMKISFANALAELCERLPGGDVDAVTAAVGTDSRIGRRYLTGSLGYGGPCFPRDTTAMSRLAELVGSEAPLAEATETFNRSLLDRTIRKLRSRIAAGTPVAVLGLAYKPHSHVVEASQGLYLAKALAAAGARVVAYDPLVDETARAEIGDGVRLSSSVHDCIEGSEVVLIATPDDLFRTLRAEDFSRGPGPRSRRATVIDFWRILAADVAESGAVDYIAAGRDSDPQANADRLRCVWDEAVGRPVS